MSAGTDWYRFNQQYLMTALQDVREELEVYNKGLSAASDSTKQEDIPDVPARHSALERSENNLAPAAIETLVSIFSLSSFERKILLMCAGIELESGFGRLIAEVLGNNSHGYPTFSLALAAFGDAHWTALTPESPLRYWNLIKLNADQTLTKAPLKIDEYILHYLAGVRKMDEHLLQLLQPVDANGFLASSQTKTANDIVVACVSTNGYEKMSVIHINSGSSSDKMAIAATACSNMGLTLFALPVLSLPGTAKEVNELVRLWNREAALHSFALLIDCSQLDTTDKLQMQLLHQFIEAVQSVLVLNSNGWKTNTKRYAIEFAVHKPAKEEQLFLWHQHLGEDASRLNGTLGKVVSHFNLTAKSIETASRDISVLMKGEDDSNLSKMIWKTCCVHTRPKIDELAQRIEPVAGWDDLVLPEAQKEILREIALQVKHRRKVYDDWGFSTKGNRGLGISVLFAGESGTGKTMASEVLANELQLDLYRIDLSQVVNKYIGETEKNLKRIFDAAEEGGAILLFDEADALFGKRSDVKDSHDRYSNIEVSYLLQRMEAYTGLAVLTTNLKSAIDKAFLRRIRFVVQFPYPDNVLRAEIWKRVFPSGTPVKNLDIEKLSKLSVPGGNIRNIALNAAFIAADEDVPVQMSHIYKAARSEYSKIEKAFSSNETGNW